VFSAGVSWVRCLGEARAEVGDGNGMRGGDGTTTVVIVEPWRIGMGTAVESVGKRDVS